MNPIYLGLLAVIAILLVLLYVPLPARFQIGLIFLDVILTAFIVAYMCVEGDETI